MQDKVRLSDVFVCAGGRREFSLPELVHLPWQRSFLRLMEQRLQMVFSAETEDANVCFAGDSGLRNDFKTQFTAEELRRYVAACLPDERFVSPEAELPLPANPAAFFSRIEGKP